MKSLGAGFYYWSSLLVVAGVWFGVNFVPQQGATENEGRSEQDFQRIAAGLSRWDGIWYSRICRNGYTYDPDKASSVAFFPAYPMLARGVMLLTGFSATVSLLLVSHTALLASFMLIPVLLRRDDHGDRANETESTASESAPVLIAFGLWPTTFFFRTAYTESLFILFVILALLGFRRRWPLALLALIVGCATATRGVGVALVPVLVWHIWSRSSTCWSFSWRSIVLVPASCWGLLCYMGYLASAFGDPLAFSQTQTHWATRTDPGFSDRVVSLATLEPLWSVYDPSSKAYWARSEHVATPLFSLQFLNPVYFVITIGLVVVGACKNWLSREELILSAGLLLIPYVTHSYRAIMMGQARYAASVFSAYLVMGKLLSRCPPPVAGIVVAFSSFFLGIYSALFASGYRYI